MISLILVLGEWDDGYSYGIMLLVMAWFEGKNGTGRNALYFLGKPMASCRCSLFIQIGEDLAVPCYKMVLFAQGF